MKKVRIFFGITLVGIAIAAAAATKAKKVDITLYYYPSLGVCAPATFPNDPICSTGGTGCTAVINGVSRQLYLTQTSSSVCSDPLKK